MGVEGDGVREGQGAYAPFVVDTCVVRGDSDWDGGDDALVAGSAVGHCRQRGTAHSCL